MNTNPEHIPSEIFNWMEHSRFSELSKEQQNTVLRYFSREEYEELYHACTSIQDAQQAENSHRHDAIKNSLLSRFDQVHSKNKGKAYAPMFLWKAAAALLATGFITVMVMLVRQNSTALPSMISSTDTVYITKEVQASPLVSYDTVVLEKIIYKQAAHEQKRQSPAQDPVMPVYSGDEKLNTVTIRDLESILNSSRGNSMKDDSLPKKYSFTTL